MKAVCIRTKYIDHSGHYGAIEFLRNKWFIEESNIKHKNIIKIPWQW